MEFKRDFAREELFNSNYHIKPEVYVGYEVNPDNTFKEIILKLKYKDKEYILDEHYEGTTNMTDVVNLIYEETTETFKNNKGAFNDAEHRLVELMKEI